MICLKNVDKVYRGAKFETKALLDVSLEIQDGEFVAVMGESGSGKTTLLNILGGMDHATGGEVWFDDVNTQTLKPEGLDRFRKKNISFIFQHFVLMEEYTVYENLEAPLLARNVKKSERNRLIKDAMAYLGIEDLIYQLPSQISGGQKQRVAIARSIVSGCPIIMADEPTGALDEENTKNVMQLLQSLHENGKTIIVITHDQQVANYADRIIFLHNGRIV